MCGPLELDPSDKTRETVLNPTVLTEVLSPSTEGDDRGPKLDCYKLIASVTCVVLVTQDKPEVTLHEKRADGSWLTQTLENGTVLLRAVATELPLSEIYENLPEPSA